MKLETTFRLSHVQDNMLEAHGQGRVIGFAIRRFPPEPSRMVIIHLDHPGVAVEADIPQADGLVSDPHFFILATYITWVPSFIHSRSACRPKTSQSFTARKA